MNKLWRAPSLRGPWTLSGAHFASNRTVLEHRPAGGDRHDEFTTPDFFGALQGDPRGGRTRVFTTTMVDTMFFLGRRRRKAGAFGTTGRLMVRLSPLKTAAGPEPRQGRATTAAIRAAAPAAAAWAGVGRAAGRGARPVRQGAWRRQHRRVRCRSRSEPHEQPGLHHCWRHRCQAAERQRGVATRDDASLRCYVDHSLVSCIGNNRTGVARFTRPMENASAAVVLHAP